jgi:hypothetical protein
MKEYIGKEVFIVAYSEEETTGGVFITDDWEALTTYMNLLSVDCDYDKRVLHGVLTAASVLPQSIMNKNVFVISLNPNKNDEGVCVDLGTSSVEEVAKCVEKFITESHVIAFDTEVDIDDVFILYGYQLPLCLSVSYSELDEEVIDTCEGMLQEINEIRKKVFGGRVDGQRFN